MTGYVTSSTSPFGDERYIYYGWMDEWLLVGENDSEDGKCGDDDLNVGDMSRTAVLGCAFTYKHTAIEW
jgi:hypothetical protein